LITFTKVGEPIDSVGHIAIIYDLEYDFNYNQINRCFIIHARGGTNPYFEARVRYDNFIEEYLQYGRYQYRFLNWE